MTRTDAELDAMSGGDFYHYMLMQDHFEWARQCNRMGRFNLNPQEVELLAGWFANAMMAMVDRPYADYIRARLDSEQAEDRNRK